ncbi:MAG: alpha/beta fold hydrolase [Gemmatimonadaceae bacterium]
MPKKIYQSVREERQVSGGRRIRLELRGERTEPVPAILLLPPAAPAPAALLLHGYTSHKERVADSLGSALLAEGIASLAIDLPLHGERERDEVPDIAAARSPLEMIRRWRAASEDCTLALRYLGAHRGVDSERLALVGYSLGAFLGLSVAAREPAVRAVVLAAGGDLPDGSPFTALVRTMVDPLRSVRKLAGRPLLMVHGKWDRTVRPPQAERLFAAASEPKEIRWWDAGHILPEPAVADAARWLADRLRAAGAQRAGA